MRPDLNSGHNRIWSRLWADRSARAGLLLVLCLVLCALLAGVIAPEDPNQLGLDTERLQPPDRQHLLGTDTLGRDVFARLLYGSRVSLSVAWISVVVAVLCGTLVGLLAGLGPASVDRLLMGLTDIFLAFPRIFLVLLLISLMTPSVWLVMLVLGLTGWMSVARLVRAEVLSLKERNFILAARGLGLGISRIALYHILPNVLPTIIVAATLRVGNTILLESFLSYLGLGAQEPVISWGAMIQQGRPYLLEGWWLTTFPGLVISLTVIGYNLLGDGLRDALDPRNMTRGGNHDRELTARS